MSIWKPKEFENLLIPHREKLQMSIVEVSRQIGTTPTNYRNLELGLISPVTSKGEFKPYVQILFILFNSTPQELFPLEFCELELSSTTYETLSFSDLDYQDISYLPDVSVDDKIYVEQIEKYVVDRFGDTGKMYLEITKSGVPQQVFADHANCSVATVQTICTRINYAVRVKCKSGNSRALGVRPVKHNFKFM